MGKVKRNTEAKKRGVRGEKEGITHKQNKGEEN